MMRYLPVPSNINMTVSEDKQLARVSVRKRYIMVFRENKSLKTFLGGHDGQFLIEQQCKILTVSKDDIQKHVNAAVTDCTGDRLCIANSQVMVNIFSVQKYPKPSNNLCITFISWEW